MKRPPNDKAELLRWLQLQGDADRRILAHLWHVPDQSEPAALYKTLADPERVAAQWSRLTDAEREAMTRVLQEGGALPSATLQRTWGVIREPARFSNPRAYLEALDAPSSPAERLYMMALLVRDHDERGPIFRVLNDLRPLLPPVEPLDRILRVAPSPPPAAFEPALPDESERTVLALLELADAGVLKTLDDGALNKASLVRLAARVAPGAKLVGVRREADWPWIALLRDIAVGAGLLHRTTDGQLHVAQEATGWLQSTRAERLSALVRGWIASTLDELTLLCGLSLRSLPFDLRLPESRRALLSMFSSLPTGEWLPVDAIVSEVERVSPDFLRRSGRYDAWLLYDASGRRMAGEESWPLVEGALVSAVLLGVLRWLGLADVAGTPKLDRVRFTPIADHVIHGAPAPSAPAPEPLAVQGTFEIICPPGASPWARFQLLRIAELVSDEAASVFRLTRRSVLQAADRGITGDDVLRFLEEYGRAPIPQGVAAYIREWSGQVGRLRLEEAALLRADDPLHLLEVRRMRGVDLPPVEELAPAVWKVAPGDASLLFQQLQRAGFSIAADATDRAAGADRRGTPALSDHDLNALVTAAYAYAFICADLGVPCEISASMLRRLQKLVPTRQAEAARRAARELSGRLQAGAGGDGVVGEAAAAQGRSERYA